MDVTQPAHGVIHILHHSLLLLMSHQLKLIQVSFIKLINMKDSNDFPDCPA